MTSKLRINEVFYSLQGESIHTGYPTIFIRLSGCPLRCTYCDTEYAFHGGQWQTTEQIVTNIRQFNTLYVCVTGGEPLAQPSVHGLMDMLVEKGYHVSLETSGALDISTVNSAVTIVMDLKTPSSGEQSKNLLSNIDHLSVTDVLKFVIGTQEDYDWAVAVCERYQLTTKVASVFFSACFELMSPTVLAEWILRDQLTVRFQLQLHKYLWGDKPGH